MSIKKKYYKLFEDFTMKQFLTLLLIAGVLFISDVNAAKYNKLPRYMEYDFVPGEYDQAELNRYIKFNGMKNIYIPERITEKEKAVKVAPQLMKSDLVLKQVYAQNGSQEETWIAVNPTNPMNAIATCNDTYTNGGDYRMSAYYTHDGGKTWKFSRTAAHNNNTAIPMNGSNATIFDPGICFTPDGMAIYSYGFAETLSGNDKGKNGIFASVSTDGGATWNQPKDVFDTYGITVDMKGEVFNDRYTIGSDVYSESDYKGNVYVSWKLFDSKTGSPIVTAFTNKKKDEYHTWDAEVVHIATNTSTQAPMPTCGPDGNVYVTFRNSGGGKTSAPVYRSTNGGKTYQSFAQALDLWDIGEVHPESGRYVLNDKDGMRVSINPQIVVDNSFSPRRGTIYVIMTGRDESAVDDIGLWLAQLRPGEKNWRKDRIDNNKLGNDMFFPSITVDPTTGYVHIFYYSSQNYSDNKLVDAYYAYSYDGENFKQRRLTNEGVKVRARGQGEDGNRYWGDYTSIAASENMIYPLFWLPGNSQGGAIDLYTSLITTAPVAPENFKITNGESVVLSWDDDIRDGLGEEIKDYTVVLYKNGNEIGTFPKNEKSYTDSEVTVGETVKYGVKVISDDKRGEGQVFDYQITVGGELESRPIIDFSAIPDEKGVLFRWTNPNLSIDDATFNEVSSVSIYQNSSKIAEVISGNMVAGEINEYLFETETEKFYEGFYATVNRQRESDKAESVPSDTIMAYSGAALDAYDFGFEVTEGEAIILTGDSWGVTSEIGFNSDNCFTDLPNEKYPKGPAEYSVIFQPSVYNTATANLSFRYIGLLADGDECFIDVTRDGGETWEAAFYTNDDFNTDLSTSEWILGAVKLSKRGFEDGDIIMFRITFKTTSFADGDGMFFDEFQLSNLVSVSDENYKPLYIKAINNLSLNQDLMVEFGNNNAENLRLEIYDNLGNKVSELFNEYYPAGKRNFSFSAESFASGVYHLVLSGGNTIVSTQINVVK
jgi:BNR/Asp-box repeat